MKDCQDRREQIIDLLEDQLSVADRAELMEHIKRCANCAEEYNKLKNLGRVMASDRIEYPPKDVFERMKSAARQKVVYPNRRLLRRLFKVSVPAFALAVILFFILRSQPDTVDMNIPVAHLLEDEEIAEIAVTGIINNDLVKKIEVMEEQLSFNTDEAIEEMSAEQRHELVSSLRRRYTVGT
jgi:anti-sigma factor RsiW